MRRQGTVSFERSANRRFQGGGRLGGARRPPHEGPGRRGARCAPGRSSGFALALACALAPAAAHAGEHLLLSEVVLAPGLAEAIEVANPTSQPVALEQVHLADTPDYALLPGAFGAGPAPQVGATDFIARFPAGASIPAGGVVVVALDGAGYFAHHGHRASFELKGTDPLTPDLVGVLVGATPSLANQGEPIALFLWDGQSDLVTDLDLVHVGVPDVARRFGAKTGLLVDGPDADATPSAYLAEAGSLPVQALEPASGLSTKRVRLEQGHEARAPGVGNGVLDHDETSEDLGRTWDGGAPGVGPAAFSAPTLGRYDFPDLFVVDEQSPPVTPLLAGARDVVIAAFTLAASTTPVTLEAIALEDLGTGDVAAIDRVALWHDADGDGVLDTAPGRDALLAEAAFAGGSRALTLVVPSPKLLGLPVGQPMRVFVAYDVAAGAALAFGETFRARIDQTSVRPAAATFGLPIFGAEHNGLPELRFASLGPADQSVDAGQADVVLCDVEARTTAGQASLGVLTLALSGTGDPDTEVALARLVLDSDGSGTVTPADLVLDEASFAAGAVTVDLDAGSLAIDAAGVRLLIALTFSSALQHQSTFEATLDGPGGAVVGATPRGLPLDSSVNARLTADLKPTLVVTSLGPTAPRAISGAQNVVVLAFSLGAQNLDVWLSDLDLAASGTGLDDLHVERLRLIRDANGDGVLQVGVDLEIERRAFGVDDGILTLDFGGVPIAIAPGALERFFVVYDLAATAPIGATFRVTLDNPATTATRVVGLPLASSELRIEAPGFVQGRSGGGGGGGGCAVETGAPALPGAILLLVAVAGLAVRAARRVRSAACRRPPSAAA